MKRHFIGLSVAVMCALVFASCSGATHVETAAGVNLSNYKTFGWNNIGEEGKDHQDKDIVDEEIRDDISHQLENTGWQETSKNPDVTLDYSILVEEKVNREPVSLYNYHFMDYHYNGLRRTNHMYYRNDLIGFHAYDIPFNQGKITVNMIDTRTNTLIWQGSAKVDVSSRMVTAREMQTEISSIFKKFHPSGTYS